MGFQFPSILILFLILYIIAWVNAGGTSDSADGDDRDQCARKNKRCSYSNKNLCCSSRCRKKMCQCSKNGKRCVTKRDCCTHKNLDCIEGRCQESSASKNANGQCANAGQQCGGMGGPPCCRTEDVLRCELTVNGTDTSAMGTCVKSCKQEKEICGGIAGFQCCSAQNLTCTASSACCDMAGECVKKV